MTNIKMFPFIALGVGLILTVVVVAGSKTDTNGATILPLLSLLIASEFAFIVTAIGAITCARGLWSNGFTLGNLAIGLCCALLSVHFAVRGIQLWPL